MPRREKFGNPEGYLNRPSANVGGTAHDSGAHSVLDTRKESKSRPKEVDRQIRPLRHEYIAPPTSAAETSRHVHASSYSLGDGIKSFLGWNASASRNDQLVSTGQRPSDLLDSQANQLVQAQSELADTQQRLLRRDEAFQADLKSKAALDARVKSLMHEAADARQKLHAATLAATENSRKELADLDQQLSVLKSDLDDMRVRSQKYESKEQAAVVAAERSSEVLADLKQQLDIMKSRNTALDARAKSSIHEAADARQQSQAAAAVAERELTDLKQLLKSSKADLVLERAYAHQKSQRVAALADRELADWKQQLDVTKSSKAALDARVVSSMHEAADARQQLQAAAAVAEREHADLKRQLDTMTSGKAALDARQKSLMQEREESNVTIKRLRDAEDAQAGTFSLDSFRDVVDRVSEAHVSFTGHPSVERLNEAIDNMVLEALEQACEVLAAQGDSVAHFAVKPPALNTPLFASLAKRNLTEEDRGFLLDACLHSLVVPFVYGMFFQSTISTIAVDDQVEVLDKVFSKITAAEPWAVCQRWRAMAASATAIMIEPSELEKQAHHIEEQVSRSVAWAYGQPLTTFHPIRAKLLQNTTALMHDAHELSLVLKRDILSVQMMVMLDESIGRPYDPRFEESVWPEMGAKAGDSVIGVYALGLRKVTPTGQIVDVIQQKVTTGALLREIETAQ